MSALLALMLTGQSCIAQQTYTAPVQYAQTYAQPYVQNAYVEKTIFIAVEDPTSYYTGLVGTAQRAAERQAQAQQATVGTDQKIDQLTRLVLDLQKRLESQQNEPPIPSKPATPAAEPARPTLPALATPASEAAPLPPTVAQASTPLAAGKRNGPGLALLAAKCQGCHQGAATRGGGHQLFAADGSFAVRDRDLLERIETAIASGSMPKGTKQQLTLREYVSIRDYLNEQASSLALNTANPRKKIR